MNRIKIILSIVIGAEKCLQVCIPNNVAVNTITFVSTAGFPISLRFFGKQSCEINGTGHCYLISKKFWDDCLVIDGSIYARVKDNLDNIYDSNELPCTEISNL